MKNTQNQFMSGIDTQQFGQFQQKFVEASMQLQQLMVNTLQTIGQAQTDFVNQMWRQVNQNNQQWANASSLQEKCNSQMNWMNNGVEQCAHHCKNIADIVSKSQQQVMQTVTQAAQNNKKKR